MMFHICLLVFIFCNYSSANNEHSDRRRHRQRLPVTMNSILASYSRESDFETSDEADTASVNSDVPTYSATTLSTSSPTNSPNKAGTYAPVAEVTDFPTEDIFGTMAPTSKPTASPTVTSRPSVEDDGLPTATAGPTTASPVKPPTVPFPTYKPTDGFGDETENPALGSNTYPPTEEVVLPTPSPSVSWGPSSRPSETVSDAPSKIPSTEPSSSSQPTEIYRPSSSPTVSSFPSSTPSSNPNSTPSTEPSMQPSEYGGETTSSIGDSGTFVSAFGCESNATKELFDGTTYEYVCEQYTSNENRMLVEQGFVISPNLSNPSIVEKLRVYAAHNCSECDPVKYAIEGSMDGSLDDDSEWEMISSGDLPWIDDENTARNEEGIAIVNSTYSHGDESLSFTEVEFDNVNAFVHYRLSFPRTRDGDFKFVVAEVELPGRKFEAIPTSSPTAKPTRRTRRPSPATTKKPTKKPRPQRTRKPIKRPTPNPKTSQPQKQRTRKPSRVSRTRRPTPRPTRVRREKKVPTSNPHEKRTPEPNSRPAPRPSSRMSENSYGYDDTLDVKIAFVQILIDPDAEQP